MRLISNALRLLIDPLADPKPSNMCLTLNHMDLANLLEGDVEVPLGIIGLRVKAVVHILAQLKEALNIHHFDSLSRNLLPDDEAKLSKFLLFIHKMVWQSEHGTVGLARGESHTELAFDNLERFISLLELECRPHQTWGKFSREQVEEILQGCLMLIPMLMRLP